MSTTLRVVIESPYNGPTPEIIARNVAYAKRAVMNSLHEGESPIASHLLFTQHGLLLDAVPEERKLGIGAGHAWIPVAHLVVFYIDYGMSPGMEEAKEVANQHGVAWTERKIGGKPVTQLKVVFAAPPNIAAIGAAFPFAVRPGAKTYFCYGRTIYSPAGIRPSPALMAHEAVHAIRQGNDVEGWWESYIADQKFRFDEELPAHVAEFRWYDGKTLRERQFQLRQIAYRLAGPLYGRLVTPHAAKVLISGNPRGEP